MLENFSKKEIIFVTKKLDVGGTEKHLLKILPELNKIYRVKIFVLNGEGTLEKIFMKHKIEILKPKIIPKIIPSFIFNFLRLYKLMRRNKKSIFHFYLPEPYIIGGVCGTLIRHKFMIMSRRSLNLYQSKENY